MAHRKPLGTTCRTNAGWAGDDPYLHDALVTPAGTWYRIVGIEETASMRAALLLPVDQRRFKINLVLERVTAQQVEDGLVHWPDGFTGRPLDFEWYPRR